MVEFRRTKQPFSKTIYQLPKEKVRPKNYRKNVFIEYWNTLPGLRHHKGDTATYRQASASIKELLQGLSSRPWDTHWIKQHRINARFLREPWSESGLYRAMDILCQMVSIGYWPGPKSWLSAMDLSTIIYNPRKQVSWMAFARSKMSAPLSKEASEAEARLAMSTEANELMDAMAKFSIQLPIQAPEVLIQMYNTDLKVQVGPLLEHICPGISSFGRLLGSWLAAQGLTRPNSGIYPPNGWIWKKFVRSTFSSAINDSEE